MPVSIDLTLEDNKRAANVFGAYNANLAQLESQLGVDISARGSRLTIHGPEEKCKSARLALRWLYRKAGEEDALGWNDINNALRYCIDEGNNAAARQALDTATFCGPPPPSGGSIPARKEAKAAPGEAAHYSGIRTPRNAIRARSARQHEYIEAMHASDLVLGTGPAGTGKTYLAVAMAAALLHSRAVSRIVLSRPAVEAGERLGFLPGDMREKLDPYLRPLYDALYDMLPREKIDRGLQNGAIEIAPLAFMRGRTLSDSVILLDEGQNTTSIQMKMFLTRIGENSRMIITGDPSQIDLPRGEQSGLVEALDVLRDVPGIRHVRFARSDGVRHPLVEHIVRAYDKKRGKTMRHTPARPRKADTNDAPPSH